MSSTAPWKPDTVTVPPCGAEVAEWFRSVSGFNPDGGNTCISNVPAIDLLHAIANEKQRGDDLADALRQIVRLIARADAEWGHNEARILAICEGALKGAEQ